MANLRADQFEPAVRSGNLGSVYIFDGPENFLKEQTVHKIIEKLLPPEARDFNLERFDGSTSSASQIISSFQSLPWMSSRRVIIVSQAEDISSAEGKLIAQSLGEIPSTTCLLFLFEGKANLREEIPAQVASQGAIVTFWTPFPNQLPVWVQNETRQRGKTISFDASQLLAESCESLEQMINEINKLVLFVGSKKNIELTDIRAHGLPENLGDFNDFEKALWERNTPEALSQIQLLSDSGSRPESLLPIFERVFKTLLLGVYLTKKRKLSGENLFSAVGIRGKIQQGNFQKGFSAYSEAELKNSLSKVLQADLDVKTGALPGPIAVSLLTLNLCGLKRPGSVLSDRSQTRSEARYFA